MFMLENLHVLVKTNHGLAAIIPRPPPYRQLKEQFVRVDVGEPQNCCSERQ